MDLQYLWFLWNSQQCVTGVNIAPRTVKSLFPAQASTTQHLESVDGSPQKPSTRRVLLVLIHRFRSMTPRPAERSRSRSKVQPRAGEGRTGQVCAGSHSTSEVRLSARVLSVMKARRCFDVAKPTGSFNQQLSFQRRLNVIGLGRRRLLSRCSQEASDLRGKRLGHRRVGGLPAPCN